MKRADTGKAANGVNSGEVRRDRYFLVGAVG